MLKKYDEATRAKAVRSVVEHCWGIRASGGDHRDRETVDDHLRDAAEVGPSPRDRFRGQAWGDSGRG